MNSHCSSPFGLVTGVLVEFEGMEGSPCQTPPTLEELCLASGNYFSQGRCFPFSAVASGPAQLCVSFSQLFPPSAEIPVSPEILPSHPLLPRLPNSASSSAPPPLVPFSPSTSPLTLLCVDLPQLFRSPAPPSQEDPPWFACSR